MLRTGWSASSEQGATLLQQAVERDDIEIARTLIKRGANLHGRPMYGAPGTRTPALVSAVSGAMVNLLVKAGADPNEAPVDIPDGTPLMNATYKDADVAEALIQAGAHLEPLDANGRSPLWNAACSGNWRVVTVLLGAGADPRGSVDEPALECTRKARADYMRMRRTVLDEGLPSVDDFDRVIALLETADTRTKR
jgi:ankyrin repeat protein